MLKFDIILKMTGYTVSGPLPAQPDYTNQDIFEGVIDKSLRRHQISELEQATKLYFNTVACLGYLFNLLRQFL